MIMSVMSVLVLILVSLSVHGQTIRGKVLDVMSSEPVPYAHIQLLKSFKGTISDSSGHFQIEIEHGGQLKFSAVGFQTYFHTVNFPADADLNVYLIQDVQMLSEVYVVSRRANLLAQSKRDGIEIAGLPVLRNPKPIRPGGWKWDKADLLSGKIGGTLYGPFSYFAASEKQKRKLDKTYSRENGSESYLTIIHDGNTRQEICTAFDVTESEYDSLLVIFNQHHLELVKEKEPNSVKSQLYLFFSEHIP